MAEDDHWTGDVNDAVVDDWVAETTPFGRVKEVLLSTTSYQSAGEIADRARVSEPSARKHLNALEDAGLASTEDTGRGTRYKRSRETVAMSRIQHLHRELAKAELIEGIRDLKAQISSYQREYAATSPDDLALELEADDGDGWTAVSRWRAKEENLQLAQAALSLYDFDPDSERGADGASLDDSGGSRGAFAGDSGHLPG